MTELPPTEPPALTTPSKRRSSARYEQRREKIIDATIPLLNEKGVQGMTLLDVAQAVDMTATNLTYYYRFKEQLAAAAFEDTLNRLDAMIAAAAVLPTPRDRVWRYIEMIFDHYARTLRNEVRPLAILSELRTLEAVAKRRLIERYQQVFRNVRALFGPCDTPHRKLVLTARAQVLNEALFWAAIWLPRYSITDFPDVAARMFRVLEKGIAVPGATWYAEVIDPDQDTERDAKQEFLRAASRLINDIGYKGASVERIAGELKITKGSFYHHLDTKDELTLDCFRDGYRRLARIQQVVKEWPGTIWTRLSHGFASAVSLQFDGSYPLLRTTALHAMPPALRTLAIIRYERLTHGLAGTLSDGMTEGSVRIVDPMVAAQVLMSTINSAYDLRGWARKQNRPDAIALYASTLMSGLFDSMARRTEALAVAASASASRQEID